jgi:hypothetical protein
MLAIYFTARWRSNKYHASLCTVMNEKFKEIKTSIQVLDVFLPFRENIQGIIQNPDVPFHQQLSYNFALNTVLILFSTASRYSPVVTYSSFLPHAIARSLVMMPWLSTT